jgi:hypothetical protein
MGSVGLFLEYHSFVLYLQPVRGLSPMPTKAGYEQLKYGAINLPLGACSQ